jgi:hypothetical protein
MKSVEALDRKLAIRQDIRLSRPFIVFLIIWGCQWLLSSCMIFFGQWLDFGIWEPLSLWIALAASAVMLWRSFRSKPWSGFTMPGGRSIIPLIMIIGAVWTLGYVHSVDTFFIPLLKSFILAAGYAQLSVWLGRPLLYMGIWLFALTVVVAVGYLGLASAVLGGFGGLSMLALGWMLYIGSKESEGNA